MAGAGAAGGGAGGQGDARARDGHQHEDSTQRGAPLYTRGNTGGAEHEFCKEITRLSSLSGCIRGAAVMAVKQYLL